MINIAIDPNLLFIGLGLAVVVFAALCLAVMSHRRSSMLLDETEALTDLTEKMADAQQQLFGQLNHLTNVNATHHAEVGRTLNERLDQVSKRLGDRLEITAEKTGQTLGSLHTRLAMIEEARKNITDLSSQVVNLQDILSNKQTRGAFGEIQLVDIVTNALPPSAFQFQATLSNNKRADCLIHMPNPPGPIAVDAKFPLEGYRLLLAAEDEAAHAQAARAFAQDIQRHIKAIAEKYILPGETADSALMFLPSEAVYAELHTNFLKVVEQSHRARVWIVSPTTLMAVLNTVRAVLKDAYMREQAGTIQRHLHALQDDVARLDTRVANLQRHFAQAEKDIREIGTSSEKIARRANKIGDLQGDEADQPVAVVAASSAAE